MKPAPFVYKAPQTISAALSLLAQHGYDAKLLAGGQSLIPTMNFRLAQPAVLIDLNGLSELAYTRPGADGSVSIGAMTRQREVERDRRLDTATPLLAQAMPYIAHPQIRNRGTIGGSIVHADPAAELPTVAVALNARLKIASVRGERWVEASDFFQGVFAVDLEPDEMIVEVVFPPKPARTGYAFQEVARRKGDYALAGVAASVTLDRVGYCQDATLVYFAVGDRPMVASKAAGALKGRLITDEIIAYVSSIASREEIDPTNNVHASADFQRHLVRVLTGRAIRQAVELAASG